MQNIRFLGALALVSLVLASQARADRRDFQRVILGSQLMALHADPALGVIAANDGRIDIDVSARVARLVLQTERGDSFAVQVPVLSITRDACGAVLYSGTSGTDDVQTLVIRDNTDSRCASVAFTEITLTRQVRGGQRSVSTFHAERLARQQPTYIVEEEIDDKAE